MVDSSTLPVLRFLTPNLGWQILRGSPGVARNSYLVFVSCCYALVVGKQVLSSEVFFALFTNRPLSLLNQTLKVQYFEYCTISTLLHDFHCVARFPLCCTISIVLHDFHCVARFATVAVNATQCDTGVRH